MSITVKVKCVGCGVSKVVGEEQKELPVCGVCLLPMVAVSAESK